MGEKIPSPSWRERLRTAVGAWQPLTGRGIAAFATASAGRLLLFQFLFAALVALAAVWSVRRISFPVVQNALAALPGAATLIQNRELRWPDSQAVVLASSPHLALIVDPEASGELGQNGDVQVELRTRNYALRGLLGQLILEYPDALELPLDRTAATAAWGAWRIPLSALLGVTSFVGILLLWWFLALLYTLPAWLLGWGMGRQISVSGALQMSSAALWPAAILPTAGMLLYATLWIRIPGLTAFWLAHLPAGWIWLVWGVLSLPPRPARDSRPVANPFQPAPTSGTKGKPATKRRNPFTS